jgi:hypothetical protein
VRCRPFWRGDARWSLGRQVTLSRLTRSLLVSVEFGVRYGLQWSGSGTARRAPAALRSAAIPGHGRVAARYGLSIAASTCARAFNLCNYVNLRLETGIKGRMPGRQPPVSRPCTRQHAQRPIANSRDGEDEGGAPCRRQKT